MPEKYKPQGEREGLRAINSVEDHSDPYDDFDRMLARIEKKRRKNKIGGSNGRNRTTKMAGETGTGKQLTLDI
jgi:ribosome-associated translation inhibitor RaiA